MTHSVFILDLNQNKMIDYLKKENIYFLLKKYELEEYFNEIIFDSNI